MASASQKRANDLENLDRSAEGNQADIDKLESSGRRPGDKELEALYARQRGINEQRNTLRASSESTSRVTAGIEQGAATADRLMPEGSLGRVQGPSAEMDRLRGKILEQRESRLDSANAKEAEGLSTFEKSLIESRGLQTIQRTEETNRRRLQAIQNRMGVRGGAATAQQLSILGEGSRQRSELAQNLSFQDIQLKRQSEENIRAEQGQALDQLTESVEGRISFDRSLQKENIRLEAAERAAKFSLAFGLTGLAEQSLSVDKSVEAAKASANAGSGGGKK